MKMGTDARWMDIEAISNIEVLPEETLRRIAKGSLTELTLECDDFEYDLFAKVEFIDLILSLQESAPIMAVSFQDVLYGINFS